MNAREVRAKEDKELRYDLKNLTKELFDLRFQSASENISNTSRINQIKKDVARIMTVLNEREKGIRGANPK
ncbi:MAG: 50S ribosomal protein L29 [Planctomycetota bacterium]|jgi:large subunit ribosomal protein L29